MGIYNASAGVHCNSHDDYAYKQLYGTPCTGGESIDLPSDGSVASLNPVVGGTVQKAPHKAVIVLETDGSEGNGVAARFKMCGGDPDADNGFPLGAMGQVQVCGASNISNFKIATTTPGAENKVRVMYFE